MPKITFLGAGSTIFAKIVLGDCMLRDDIENLDISLHDIDAERLRDSERMLTTIAKNLGVKAAITASLDRRQSLKGANYVINAVQVGGYKPCTVTDFVIPKKYGLRQTIADTLGIGGMQVCVPELMEHVGMPEQADACRWEIAGINHQSWLLRCEDLQGNDLYPEIKRRAKAFLDGKADYPAAGDKVRLEMMLKFGYYLTESSEHNAEYTPWFIKSGYPELIERYNIPLDEYPRRCVAQIAEWKELRRKVVEDDRLAHETSREYAAGIIAAMENDVPYRVHANVPNTGLIPNLPAEACVEVPCLVDRSGVTPCFVGNLPEQCAAINRTNINVHLLAMKAARSRKKEDVYMAAMLDPHTAAELSMDDIISLCDELFEAHGDWMPEFN